MLEQTADIVAYGPDGRRVLIVEVKNLLRKPRDWAAKLRRNIFMHGLLPQTEFFLLALPDHFYLWKNAPNTTEEVEPTYEIDPTSLFLPYYQRIEITPETMSRGSFEMIVTSLLNNVIYQDADMDECNPVVKAFHDSGLIQAVKGGRVDIEVPL